MSATTSATATMTRTATGAAHQATEYIVGLLEGIDLFADLSPTELGQLAQAFTLARARPGQALETQDTPVRRWNIIVGGQALVEREHTPFALLCRGESWSEYSLLNRQHSPIGVVALSPVTVLFVTRHRFFQLIDDHPGLHHRLVTRSATSADRLAQPVFRALVNMEVAALRRTLATKPQW
jgi:CRP-like cAMP-binding protein